MPDGSDGKNLGQSYWPRFPFLSSFPTGDSSPPRRLSASPRLGACNVVELDARQIGSSVAIGHFTVHFSWMVATQAIAWTSKSAAVQNYGPERLYPFDSFCLMISALITNPAQRAAWYYDGCSQRAQIGLGFISKILEMTSKIPLRGRMSSLGSMKSGLSSRRAFLSNSLLSTSPSPSPRAKQCNSRSWKYIGDLIR
jgi:hypothetical protein